MMLHTKKRKPFQIKLILTNTDVSEVVYRTIKSMRESNYPVEKLEILAFDDCSKDDSFEWIQKAAHDFPNVIARLNQLFKLLIGLFIFG